MRLTLLTYGSRGDVQPYVALGVRLQAAGHQVRLACPARFADFVTENGLDFYPLPGDTALLAEELVDQAGRNPFANVRVFMRFAIPLAVQVFEAAREACADAEAVIHNFPMTNSGEMIATEMEIPHLAAVLLPIFTSTSAFGSPALAPLPNIFNRSAHKFFIFMFWHPSRISYNRIIRPRAPHLPPLGPWPFAPGKPHDTPIIYGFSPAVLSQPTDWPTQRHVSGYWNLPAGERYQPPEALQAFLEAGPPPVYVGFGSVITQTSAKVREAVLEALHLAGQRGVLLGGWGGFTDGELPDTIFALDAASHDWLFPQMTAIVHHGGAGTTAASLRSGKPTIIVPFNSDQPFWGERVWQLGAGPKPIPIKRLTGKKLASAIMQAIDDQEMRQRAVDLGNKIRAEDGTGEAVRLIEQYLS